MPLQQYGIIRIRRLLSSPGSYDGWRVNQRLPLIEDMGVIVDVLHTPGLPDRYVVESIDADGTTVWLGDFSAEELEMVNP